MSQPTTTDPSWGPPRPGWYDDPTEPGRDRWWNGYQWTEASARTPRRSYLGPGYARSFRTRHNPAAAVGKWSAFAVLLIWLITTVVGRIAGGIPGWLAGVAIALATIVSVGGLVASVIGLRRSQRLGGAGAAIYGIVLGSLVLFTIFMTFVYLAAGLPV